ncbi:MAG: protoglobin domain-containing protein [Myxococcota bacterium]
MTEPGAPHELEAYFQYGPRQRELLAALRPALEKEADGLVEAFYRHLLSFPATQQHLRDPAVTEKLLGKQRDYLLSLAGPEIDAEYLAGRREIGEAHARIGVEPAWVLGAYSLYQSLLIPVVLDAVRELERVLPTFHALQRLLSLDASLVVDAYMARHQRDLEYLNKELAASGRRLAQDLERKDTTLRYTAERARAAERLASIGTLVAGLAHEIGTPMGVIQGHAKLLEGAVEGDNAHWRLRTIQEQIGRISRILQSLLNMARPGSPRRVPIDLSVLLENTLAFLQEKFARRGIQLKREFAQAPSVHGDPERLQQVFLNLFLNAADAMPKGGELRVSLGPRGDEAEIHVADTGHGMPSADHERIFEPFYTTKAAGEGSGLGLSVVEGIVAEHGGAIEVVQSDDSGTEFRLLLPRG